ncbi:hypothetical protein [Natronorarus salvus]|uniref:hypothetical protein n=1 Tax=Natronorarus salvus TaxID=3117733 RepID=UPI002F265182
MRVRLSSTIDCSPERLWTETLTTRLLAYVLFPFVSFSPLCGEFPEIWFERRYPVRILAFGLVPVARHTIDVSIPVVESTPGTQRYVLVDDGSGPLFRTWRHTITVEERGGETVLIDEVRIDSGYLTPFAWLFAHVLYRYRQYRIRRLAARGFEYPERIR